MFNWSPCTPTSQLYIGDGFNGVRDEDILNDEFKSGLFIIENGYEFVIQ